MRLGFEHRGDEDGATGDADKRDPTGRAAAGAARELVDGSEGERAEEQRDAARDDEEAAEGVGVLEVEAEVGGQVDEVRDRGRAEGGAHEVDVAAAVLVKAGVEVQLARVHALQGAKNDHLVGLAREEAIAAENFRAARIVRGQVDDLRAVRERVQVRVGAGVARGELGGGVRGVEARGRPRGLAAEEQVVVA